MRAPLDSSRAWENEGEGMQVCESSYVYQSSTRNGARHTDHDLEAFGIALNLDGQEVRTQVFVYLCVCVHVWMVMYMYV